MKHLFPLLYGFYLSLGLLVLQPFSGMGLSPLGALCLFMLGSGLANFISGSSSLSYGLRLPQGLFGQVVGCSAIQVLGLGAFLAGVLSGAGLVSAITSLIYGTVAGTVWSRFVRARGFGSLARVGVVLASLVLVFQILFEVSGLHLVFLDSRVWVARSLTAVGGILWGSAQYIYSARETGVSRKVWSLWESMISVVFILFLSGLALAVTGNPALLSKGFLGQPLFVLPFLLSGVIFGALRQRLVHNWELRLTAKVVQLLWIGGAGVMATVCVFAFLPNSGREAVAELVCLCFVALGSLLIRFENGSVSDYEGLRQVKVGPVQLANL